MKRLQVCRTSDAHCGPGRRRVVAGDAQEVGEQPVAVLRCDALGMELHAMEWVARDAAGP